MFDEFASTIMLYSLLSFTFVIQNMKMNDSNTRREDNKSDDDQFSKQSWESKFIAQMEFDKPPTGPSEKVLNDKVLVNPYLKKYKKEGVMHAETKANKEIVESTKVSEHATFLYSLCPHSIPSQNTLLSCCTGGFRRCQKESP